MKKKESRVFILFLAFLLLILASIASYYRRPYVKHFPNGSITVHQVEHRSDIDAKFVVVTRIGSSVIVEVLQNPGEENTKVLKGGEAEAFLQKLQLS